MAGVGGAEHGVNGAGHEPSGPLHEGCAGVFAMAVTRARRVAVAFVAFAALLQLVAGCVAQALPGGGAAQPARDEPHALGPFGRGINFGNALEAPVEGEWGLTITERHVRTVADAGFQTVRLPVRWSAHAATTAPYRIDPDFLARVDEVVGWVLDHDLQVIVNVHHYDALATDPPAHLQRWLGIWRQLAEHYRNAPRALAFELLNEPYGALDDERWNSMVREALAIVRETNPTRLVVIGPTNWNAIGALPGLALPDDDHLVLSVHFYDPFEFTHQGAEWIRPPPPVGVAWTGTQRTPAAGWQDWSWDTERAYGAELTLAFRDGWAGFYLQSSQVVDGYTHLALRTSRGLDLLALCNAGDSGAVPIRTAGGVEQLIDLHDCGGGAGVPRVILQNGSDQPQPPFVLETLELRGPDKALALLVDEAGAVAAAFDLVLAWAEANGGLPVFVGEFGAYGLADMPSRVRWTRVVREAIEARGFGWAYWEFAAGFGAFDQMTGAWRSDLLEALLGDCVTRRSRPGPRGGVMGDGVGDRAGVQPHPQPTQPPPRAVASRAWIRNDVGVTASPPSEVQRCSRGMRSATALAASTTSSNGMSGSKPASAMLAQARALLAAMTFLPRHGASTRLAMGSQMRPSMLCSAMEAAARA